MRENAEYCLGISAADANTAWAVERPYIVLKTTNGGATWTTLDYPGAVETYVNGIDGDMIVVNYWNDTFFRGP